MISVRVSKLEGPIADRQLIAQADRTTRRRGLRMLGQDMRSWMRRQIKLAKRNADGTYNASRPGAFPRYRNRIARGFDRDGNPILKRVSKSSSLFAGSAGIIYAYDGGTETVVVGPRKFGGGGRPMPQNLEFGGSRTVSTSTYSRARHRKVGGAGEIVTGRRRGGDSTKIARRTNRGNVRVTYARLRSGAQADRANRINRDLYLNPGESPPTPSGKKTVTTAARPYIRPTYRRWVDSGYARDFLAALAYESITGTKITRPGKPN